MNKREVLIIGIGIGLLFSIVFGLYSFTHNNGVEEFKKFDVQDNYFECDNLSLEETAYCLRDFVRPYYNYTLRYQHESDRSIQDVLAKGGSCIHYAHLYKEMAENLGFKGDFLIHNSVYDKDKRIISKHRWVIIWDDETKCEIDNLNVYCNQRR